MVKGGISFVDETHDEPRVRLMHHDAAWRQEFQQTRSSLLQSCEGWVTRVEHVGSTAIAGLIARPTIDVIAGVDDPRGLSEAAMLIEGLNYRRIDSPDWASDSITLQKPRVIRHQDSVPTHLVFLVSNQSESLSSAIAIRDHLRAHAEEAIRFEETKVARWRNGRGLQQRYEADKSIYFRPSGRSTFRLGPVRQRGNTVFRDGD